MTEAFLSDRIVWQAVERIGINYSTNHFLFSFNDFSISLMPHNRIFTWKTISFGNYGHSMHSLPEKKVSHIYLKSEKENVDPYTSCVICH